MSATLAAPSGGPRPGLRFEHSRQIVGSPKAGTARPAICIVTRVTRTTVYFRNQSGYLSATDRDRFPAAVGRILK